ncbi:MAG: hydantoinase/oxoprolinase family protein, partial [Halobacteria archaeon]|nr:hydantoinase/oxoprolinase family protein [Halobacteria archaeon]
MLSQDAVLATPSHTVRSGPAASALGLVALSGVDKAVCVDIGGTTTDITLVENGFPELEEGFVQDSLHTFYEGVKSLDLSMGGDTRIDEDGLTQRREGDAAAFGGPYPTPTDALHVLGDFEMGDKEASVDALSDLGEPQEVADRVVDEFASRIAEGVRELDESHHSTLVAGGVLAPYFADRIADRVDWIHKTVVPEYARVAGAVGCAVARVSVKTNVHIDTARGKMTVASAGPEKVTEVTEGKEYTDIEARKMVKREALKAAVDAGGDEDSETEILSMRKFNVVEKSWVVGQIVDATAQAVPGINDYFRKGDL